jgi:hypothetical protein
MSKIAISSNILQEKLLKDLLHNHLRVYGTKKSPELRSGLLHWHKAYSLVFNDADRFGCFGYF